MLFATVTCGLSKQAEVTQTPLGRGEASPLESGEVPWKERVFTLFPFPPPFGGLSFKTSARLGLLLTKDFLDAKAPCNSLSWLLSGAPNTTSRIWVIIGWSAKSKTLASSKVIIDTQVDHKSSRLQ